MGSVGNCAEISAHKNPADSASLGRAGNRHCSALPWLQLLRVQGLMPPLVPVSAY